MFLNRKKIAEHSQPRVSVESRRSLFPADHDKPNKEKEKMHGLEEEISSIQRARKVEQFMLQQSQSDLTNLRVKHRSDVNKRDSALRQMKHDEHSLRNRIALFEEDLYDEDLVAGYAFAVTKGNPNLQRSIFESSKSSLDGNSIVGPVDADVDEGGYAKQLESKLCKAMQSVLVIENQMKLLKASSNDCVKQYRDELKIERDEKDRLEIDFMNKLVTFDTERKVNEQQLLGKLNVREERIQRMDDVIAELKEDAIALHSVDSAEEKEKEISAMLALSKLKEEFYHHIENTKAIHGKHVETNKELLKELDRLQNANKDKQQKLEEKQKRLDFLEIQAGLAEIEGTTTLEQQRYDGAAHNENHNGSDAIQNDRDSEVRSQGLQDAMQRSWKAREMNTTSIRSTDMALSPLQKKTRKNSSPQSLPQKCADESTDDEDDDVGSEIETETQHDASRLENLAELMDKIANVTRDMEKDLKVSLKQKKMYCKVWTNLSKKIFNGNRFSLMS